MENIGPVEMLSVKSDFKLTNSLCVTQRVLEDDLSSEHGASSSSEENTCSNSSLNLQTENSDKSVLSTKLDLARGVVTKEEEHENSSSKILEKSQEERSEHKSIINGHILNEEMQEDSFVDTHCLNGTGTDNEDKESLCDTLIVKSSTTKTITSTDCPAEEVLMKNTEETKMELIGHVNSEDTVKNIFNVCGIKSDIKNKELLTESSGGLRSCELNCNNKTSVENSCKDEGDSLSQSSSECVVDNVVEQCVNSVIEQCTEKNLPDKLTSNQLNGINNIDQSINCKEKLGEDVTNESMPEDSVNCRLNAEAEMSSVLQSESSSKINTENIEINAVDSTANFKISVLTCEAREDSLTGKRRDNEAEKINSAINEVNSENTQTVKMDCSVDEASLTTKVVQPQTEEMDCDIDEMTCKADTLTYIPDEMDCETIDREKVSYESNDESDEMNSKIIDVGCTAKETATKVENEGGKTITSTVCNNFDSEENGTHMDLGTEGKSEADVHDNIQETDINQRSEDVETNEEKQVSEIEVVNDQNRKEAETMECANNKCEESNVVLNETCKTDESEDSVEVSDREQENMTNKNETNDVNNGDIDLEANADDELLKTDVADTDSSILILNSFSGQEVENIEIHESESGIDDEISNLEVDNDIPITHESISESVASKVDETSENEISNHKSSDDRNEITLPDSERNEASMTDNGTPDMTDNVTFDDEHVETNIDSKIDDDVSEEHKMEITDEHNVLDDDVTSELVANVQDTAEDENEFDDNAATSEIDIPGDNCELNEPNGEVHIEANTDVSFDETEIVRNETNITEVDESETGIAEVDESGTEVDITEVSETVVNKTDVAADNASEAVEEDSVNETNNTENGSDKTDVGIDDISVVKDAVDTLVADDAVHDTLVTEDAVDITGVAGDILDESNVMSEVDEANVMDEVDETDVMDEIDETDVMNEIDETDVIDEVDETDVTGEVDKIDVMNGVDEISMDVDETDTMGEIDENDDISGMDESDATKNETELGDKIDETDTGDKMNEIDATDSETNNERELEFEDELDIEEHELDVHIESDTDKETDSIKDLPNETNETKKVSYERSNSEESVDSNISESVSSDKHTDKEDSNIAGNSVTEGISEKISDTNSDNNEIDIKQSEIVDEQHNSDHNSTVESNDRNDKFDSTIEVISHKENNKTEDEIEKDYSMSEDEDETEDCAKEKLEAILSELDKEIENDGFSPSAQEISEDNKGHEKTTLKRAISTECDREPKRTKFDEEDEKSAASSEKVLDNCIDSDVIKDSDIESKKKTVDDIDMEATDTDDVAEDNEMETNEGEEKLETIEKDKHVTENTEKAMMAQVKVVEDKEKVMISMVKDDLTVSENKIETTMEVEDEKREVKTNSEKEISVSEDNSSVQCDAAANSVPKDVSKSSENTKSEQVSKLNGKTDSELPAKDTLFDSLLTAEPAVSKKSVSEHKVSESADNKVSHPEDKSDSSVGGVIMIVTESGDENSDDDENDTYCDNAMDQDSEESETETSLEKSKTEKVIQDKELTKNKDENSVKEKSKVDMISKSNSSTLDKTKSLNQSKKRPLDSSPSVESKKLCLSESTKGDNTEKSKISSKTTKDSTSSLNSEDSELSEAQKKQASNVDLIIENVVAQAAAAAKVAEQRAVTDKEIIENVKAAVNSIPKMTKSDLERHMMIKVAEALSHRIVIGQLRERVQTLEGQVELFRKKAASIEKQVRDMDLVSKKFFSDIKAKKFGNTLPSPAKITRSVGLQVHFTSPILRPGVPGARPSTTASTPAAATRPAPVQREQQQIATKKVRPPQFAVPPAPAASRPNKPSSSPQNSQYMAQKAATTPKPAAPSKTASPAKQISSAKQTPVAKQPVSARSSPAQSPVRSPQVQAVSKAQMIQKSAPSPSTPTQAAPVPRIRVAPASVLQKQPVPKPRATPTSPVAAMPPNQQARAKANAAMQQPRPSRPTAAADMQARLAKSGTTATPTPMKPKLEDKVIDLTDEDDRTKRMVPVAAKPQNIKPNPAALKPQQGSIRVVQPHQLTGGSMNVSATAVPASNAQRVTYLLPTSAATGGVPPRLLVTSAANSQVRGGNLVASNRHNQLSALFLKNGTFLPVQQGAAGLQAAAPMLRATNAMSGNQLQQVMAGNRAGQLRVAPIAGAAVSAVPVPAKHPAPLPPMPTYQHMDPNWKLAPPKPDLRISRVNNKDQQGIVLSWNMQVNSNHEEIISYQLYAYQESNVPPNTNLWKKVGDVKALPLPMACTLTQFLEGHKYHFAVRAVDIHSRVGPYSTPGFIVLSRK